jgi:hypothetical protein
MRQSFASLMVATNSTTDSISAIFAINRGDDQIDREVTIQVVLFE